MSFISGTKKIARFTFVSMPASIFGVNQLRMGNQQIRDLWKSLTGQTCPNCKKNILQKSTTPVGDPVIGAESLFSWECGKCHFNITETDDPKKVESQILDYIRETTLVDINNTDDNLIKKIIKTHTMLSRMFFSFSLISILFSIYCISFGGSILLAINWICLGFCFWSFGMKRSYRAWQVSRKQLFVEGAAKQWLQQEKWLI